MTATSFFDAYEAYLNSISFPSAKAYRKLLETLYAEFPPAKRKLDRMAKETELTKQLKLCAELLEAICLAKETPKDKKQLKLMKDSHSVVMKLIDFLTCGAASFSPPPPTVLTTHIPKPKAPDQKPCTPPLQGPDPDCNYVRYAEDVQDTIKVPGLCQFLETEYERILYFSEQIFGSLVSNINTRIPVYLSKECPAETHLNTDAYVTKKINELVAQGKTVNAGDVAGILRYTTRINGRFYPGEEPYIVIYFRQFKASCWEEYAAAIAKTLAHEYAHYLEFSHCLQYKATPFRDDNVSEAIADFFGVLYSLSRRDAYRVQVAKKRYDQWVRHFGSSWPYAHALYFYKINGREMPFSSDLNDYRSFGAIEKLIQVFRETPDPNLAYVLLLR